MAAFAAGWFVACNDSDVDPPSDGGTATGGTQGSTGGSRSTGGEFAADPRCPRETALPPGECRPTWEQAIAAYPKRCAPGPVQPGGCQGAGTEWCGYRTITFSYGDSRGLVLCAYDADSGALAGLVNSARGTLTCKTFDADFPPEEFFENTCRPGGAGGLPGTGGTATGGAGTGGTASGGTASGGTGGVASGGIGGLIDSGIPDANPGGSDAGQRDASEGD